MTSHRDYLAGGILGSDRAKYCGQKRKTLNVNHSQLLPGPTKSHPAKEKKLAADTAICQSLESNDQDLKI